MSRRSDLAAEFPEPEWQWVWRDLDEPAKLSPTARGLWASVRNLLTKNPSDPRAAKKAALAYSHGGYEYFETVGTNYLAVYECEYITAGKVFIDHEASCVLVDPPTAQHLVHSSGGVRVLADLTQTAPTTGLWDLDVATLVAGGVEDVIVQAQQEDLPF